MRPKIIHVLLGKANPERQNGVNKVVFELASAQQKQDVEVEVWGITKIVEVNFKKRSFKTQLFQDSPWKFKISKELKRSILNSDEKTVFHLHGGFLPQLFSVARILSNYSREYIYTPHGAYNSVALKRSIWKKKLYLALFERGLARNAMFVHVIGESEIVGTKQVIGSNTRIELIPNGHNSGGLKTTPPMESEVVHFGFLGRLDIETKGLDILIKGFSKFINEGGKGKLHIAGGGKDVVRLKSLSEEFKVSDELVFHGPVFGAQKESFFQSLHYFCLTSRNEGLPGVVLEALDHGLPCIVSQETNTGSVISSYDAGWMLRENSTNCVANILTIAADKLKLEEYKIKAVKARVLVRIEFDWVKISERFISAIHAA